MTERIPARLPKIRRADPAQLGPFTLGESHKRMLQLLHDHRYLTAPLLALAYSQDQGRGRSHVENEIGKLYQREYVERHYYSTKPTGYGSDAFVYAIAPKGAHAILDREQYAAERFAIYNRAKPKSNYQHHLAIATLQLILELGAGPWELERFHSDDADETSFAATVNHRRRWFYPDALAVLRYANGKRAGYFFEIDLAHKATERLESRFLAYAEHLTEHREELKKEHGIAGAVAVFVVANEHELDRLVDAAEDALGESNRDERRRFVLWNLESWYKRTPTGRELKDPRQILADDNANTVAGSTRRLVND